MHVNPEIEKVSRRQAPLQHECPVRFFEGHTRDRSFGKMAREAMRHKMDL